MSKNLLEAVEAIVVHELPNVRTGSLVLHPGLDQVDRIDCRGTSGTSDGALKFETCYTGFPHVFNYTSE